MKLALIGPILIISLVSALLLKPTLSFAGPRLQTLSFTQDIDQYTKLMKKTKARVLLNPELPQYLNARKNLYKQGRTRFYLEFSEEEAMLKIQRKIQ